LAKRLGGVPPPGLLFESKKHVGKIVLDAGEWG
jgi:hypothetical protein